VKSRRRSGNASLRAWVTFVKKVQREEGLSYRDAMSRAKKRKDRGEKWMSGGGSGSGSISGGDDDGAAADMDVADTASPMDTASPTDDQTGGRRRRRSRRSKRTSRRCRRGRR
jgi:hypothetical protein